MNTCVNDDRAFSADDLWDRGLLEQLLSPMLPPECLGRLWADAWGVSGVRPATLMRWCQRFGLDCAALAVAAGLTESQLREHLSNRGPDRAALEMLGDLNCFPHVTPAARPAPAAPWARHLP
jgi:hypothetical protein